MSGLVTRERPLKEDDEISDSDESDDNSPLLFADDAYVPLRLTLLRSMPISETLAGSELYKHYLTAAELE